MLILNMQICSSLTDILGNNMSNFTWKIEKKKNGKKQYEQFHLKKSKWRHKNFTQWQLAVYEHIKCAHPPNIYHIIKTVVYWHKDRHIGQWKNKERSCVYDQLIFDKDAQIPERWRIAFSTKGAGITGELPAKEWK